MGSNWYFLFIYLFFDLLIYLLGIDNYRFNVNFVFFVFFFTAGEKIISTLRLVAGAGKSTNSQQYIICIIILYFIVYYIILIQYTGRYSVNYFFVIIF